MAKVINKKYIKDFVKANLQYLPKNYLIDIAKKYDIKIKKSDYKENIAEIIEQAKGLDYWDIYKTYKNYYFGLYPSELENLLGIDKKQRKKIEGNLVKVAYYKETKADWGKINIPFYDLESLYKLDKAKLDEWKEKHKTKKATPKQLESLEKAREKVKLNLTCGICGHEVSKKYIQNRICASCRESIQEDIERESYINDLRYIKSEKDRYIIAHFETTGLSDSAEIVSCALIDLHGNVLLDVILKPSCTITDGAVSVHGITNEIAKDKGISKEEFILKFTEISKDKEILIWNLDFLKSKIINFINGGYVERYWYKEWDEEFNEKDYLEYKRKLIARKTLYNSIFPKTYDVYINYAYVTYEIEGFNMYGTWTSVHRNGYGFNDKEESITVLGCLSMLNFINKERKPMKLPQFWIDNA